MNKQTYYFRNLTSELNFMTETAHNLHLPVGQAGFRKSHPQPQRTSPLRFE
jgi:hypothetical protein